MATEQDVLDLASGKQELFRFRQRVPTLLNVRERVLFEQARERNYVVLTAGGRYNLETVWWEWCKARGQAFVCVRPRRRFSNVVLDLLPQGVELTDDGQTEARQILIRHVGQRTRATFGLGRDRADMDVEREDAEAMAVEFWQLAQRPEMLVDPHQALLARMNPCHAVEAVS